MGKLFGHKFRPRYDDRTTGAPEAAAHVENMWARLVSQTVVVFASDLQTEMRRSIEALTGHELIHTHDVCLRCGATVPAPPKRSVTVAQPVHDLKPDPQPTATQQAPAQAASPSKVKVVPISASAVAVSTGQASISHNPVKAVPGRGPKV